MDRRQKDIRIQPGGGAGTLLVGVLVGQLDIMIVLIVRADDPGGIAGYVFKFHPGIVLGVCAGIRTITAAIGQITETAKRQVPALGYSVPYAIANVLLPVLGPVIVDGASPGWLRQAGRPARDVEPGVGIG